MLGEKQQRQLGRSCYTNVTKAQWIALWPEFNIT